MSKSTSNTNTAKTTTRETADTTATTTPAKADQAAPEQATDDSSDSLSTTGFFKATVTLPWGKGDIYDDLSLLLRGENGFTHRENRTFLCPIDVQETDDGLAVTMVCIASTRVYAANKGARYDEVVLYSSRLVAEHLQQLFSAPVEVSALGEDRDHIEDLRLRDYAADKKEELQRASRRRGENAPAIWPSPEDISEVISHVLGGIDSDCEPEEDDCLDLDTEEIERELDEDYEDQRAFNISQTLQDRSSYFSVRLVTSGTVMDPAAYAASCARLRATHDLDVRPLTVCRLDNGRYEMHLIGRKVVRDGRAFPEAVYPSDGDKDLIAGFLSGTAEMRRYRVSASDVEDIRAAERIRQRMTGIKAPVASDFEPVSPEEASRIMAEFEGEAAPARPGADELAELVGLSDVKRQITELVDFAAAQKAAGAKLPGLNILMLGNPGTGKTTLARIIGHMLADKGVIDGRDVFVDGDRETLVGRYSGHTAQRTKAAIARAFHGVLFVDEAYSLVMDWRDTFGQEAVSTLVKAMEDSHEDFERKGFVCIMAGYTDLMERMLRSNPGLRDRFTFRLELPDYSAEELLQVFDLYVRRGGYTVTLDARELVASELETAVAHRGDDFGNARLVRRVFERCQMRQASLFGSDRRIKKATIESVVADEDIRSVLEGGSKRQPVGFIG